MSSAMRILFVKTSSLGDVIHHCPAITDARNNFPDAVIDWVVEESFAGIVRLHPAVRRAIPVAIRRWRTEFHRPSAWKEILRFHADLRRESYDVIVDSQGLLKSALITSLARGLSHGYDTSSAREPLASRFYDVLHAVERKMHAVDRNRALSSAALGATSMATCDYGIVAKNNLSIPWPVPFCVLLSMTSRADKLWPEQNWAELAKVLSALGLASVFPWGSAIERARSERIVGFAGSGVVPRAMSLSEMASVMTQARAVVGVDTGLTHLAAALNTPAIGVYVGSDPLLTGLHGANVLNLGTPGVVPSVMEVVNGIKAFA
jgi:heptosyltransferase-1